VVGGIGSMIKVNRSFMSTLATKLMKEMKSAVGSLDRLTPFQFIARALGMFVLTKIEEHKVSFLFSGRKPTIITATTVA